MAFRLLVGATSEAPSVGSISRLGMALAVVYVYGVVGDRREKLSRNSQRNKNKNKKRRKKGGIKRKGEISTVKGKTMRKKNYGRGGVHSHIC